MHLFHPPAHLLFSVHVCTICTRSCSPGLVCACRGLVRAHWDSFMLAGAHLLSFSLIRTRQHSFVLVHAHRHSFSLVLVGSHPPALVSTHLHSLAPTCTHLRPPALIYAHLHLFVPVTLPSRGNDVIPDLVGRPGRPNRRSDQGGN